MKAKELLTEAKLHDSVWGKRIIQAEKTGKFTRSNEVSANSWTTCACGKLDKNIPLMVKNDPSIGPMDNKLRSLGYLFNTTVKHNQIIKAAEILIKIQNRAIWCIN